MVKVCGLAGGAREDGEVASTDAGQYAATDSKPLIDWERLRRPAHHLLLAASIRKPSFESCKGPREAFIYVTGPHPTVSTASLPFDLLLAYCARCSIVTVSLKWLSRL